MTEVVSVTRRNGVAGQIAYVAKLTHPDEGDNSVTFVGSVYGGPVVMVLPSGAQTFVTDPGRFGEFGPQWVRNFFKEA